MLKTYLAVMGGGAVGTGLRFAVVEILERRWGATFPYGTLAVNVTGALVIGFFTAWAGPLAENPAPLLTRQVVVTGILGGYTTFSAFSLQAFALLARGDYSRGVLYLGLSVGLCLLGVWLGVLLAGAWARS